jgi:hypothetical protein
MFHATYGESTSVTSVTSWRCYYIATLWSKMSLLHSTSSLKTDWYIKINGDYWKWPQRTEWQMPIHYSPLLCAHKLFKNYWHCLGDLGELQDIYINVTINHFNQLYKFISKFYSNADLTDHFLLLTVQTLCTECVAGNFIIGGFRCIKNGIVWNVTA